MFGRRAVVGLALLCALVFCAVSASSATAAGTTAYTCKKLPEPGGAGFKDAHCKEAVSTGAALLGEEIAQDTPTIFHGTNDKTNVGTTGPTNAVLKGKPLGVETEVVCKKVFAHGELTNKLGATEHFIQGKKITIHYTECSVLKPAGCKIPGATIMVEPTIEATTEVQEMNVKFKPEVGNVFVKFSFEECTNVLFNGVHAVEGTVRGQVEGATLSFTHSTITTENTLKFLGAAAGLEGKITLSQAEKTEEAAKTGNPISATTVP